MDGHMDAVSCMAKNPNHLKSVFSGSMDGGIILQHNLVSCLYVQPKYYDSDKILVFGYMGSQVGWLNYTLNLDHCINLTSYWPFRLCNQVLFYLFICLLLWADIRLWDLATRYFYGFCYHLILFQEISFKPQTILYNFACPSTWTHTQKKKAHQIYVQTTEYGNNFLNSPFYFKFSITILHHHSFFSVQF